MNFEKRIAITGVGPIAATGIGKVDFWNGILGSIAKPELINVFAEDELWESFYCYKVDDIMPTLNGIHRDRFKEISEWKKGELDIDFLYLLAAIKLALQDSKLCFSGELNDASLVLAHENLGLMPVGLKLSQLAYKFFVNKHELTTSSKNFYEQFYKIFLRKGYDVQTFANLFHITKLFGIRNYSIFLNNACASGLYAFEAAAQIIHGGLSKRVVVAASDQADIYKYLWFKELGIYSMDGKIRPFSIDSNGLVFGDGGAAIVLEDFAEAKKRCAPIYAEYMGGGFNLEGWKMTLPNLSDDSYQKAIKMALERAGMEAQDVDFLCPHGVGSATIDYYEAKAIENIFGRNPKRPLISTFKPYFGHNLGGSALIESIALLLAMKHATIPPTLNISNINPKNKLTLVNERVDAEFNVAMKTCCAFAGFNSAVLFRKIL